MLCSTTAVCIFLNICAFPETSSEHVLRVDVGRAAFLVSGTVAIKPTFGIPSLADGFSVEAHAADPAHSRGGLVVETIWTSPDFHGIFDRRHTFKLTLSVHGLGTTLGARGTLITPRARGAFRTLRGGLHKHHARSLKSLHVRDSLQHGTDSSSWYGSVSEHVGVDAHSSIAASHAAISHRIGPAEHVSVVHPIDVVVVGWPRSMKGAVQVGIAKRTEWPRSWERTELTHGQSKESREDDQEE